MTRLRFVVLLAMVIGPGCVQTQSDPLPARRLLDAEWVGYDQPRDAAFVGLELEEVLTDSLDAMAFRAGLSVVSVAPASPAEQAGLRPRDVILEANGLALSSIEQWAALLETVQVNDSLTLAVERDQGVRDVTVAVRQRTVRELPVPDRFVERWKIRAEARTQVVEGVPMVEVVTLLPDSPLEDAGLEVGSRITAWEGEPLASAKEFAHKVTQAGFGQTVELEIDRGGRRKEVDVTLWEPESHLTAFYFPILVSYKADLIRDTRAFELLDFWLISLFAYQRDGETRRYSFLRFFRYETGTGELSETR